MQRTMIAMLAVLAVSLWSTTLVRAETQSGRDVFLAGECNECHTIEAEGIAKLPEKEEDAVADSEGEDDLFGFEGTDFGTEEEEEATDPPDLSSVGRDFDPAWAKQFLRKQAENAAGKRHRKLFKGTDADLDALVSFLASLKAPSEKAPE